MPVVSIFENTGCPSQKPHPAKRFNPGDTPTRPSQSFSKFTRGLRLLRCGWRSLVVGTIHERAPG